MWSAKNGGNSSALAALADHRYLEERASRVYRWAASWCALNGYPGSEKFFNDEANDEFVHATEFQQYVNDRWDGTTPLDMPEQAVVGGEDFGTGRSLFVLYSALLDFEKTVLDSLDHVGALAVSDDDFDVVRFLQKYTQVGVESIRDLTMAVQQLTRAGDDPAALAVFDNLRG